MVKFLENSTNITINAISDLQSMVDCLYIFESINSEGIITLDTNTEYLEEMSNLERRETGLPFKIYISTGQGCKPLDENKDQG